MIRETILKHARAAAAEIIGALLERRPPDPRMADLMERVKALEIHDESAHKALYRLDPLPGFTVQPWCFREIPRVNRGLILVKARLDRRDRWAIHLTDENGHTFSTCLRPELCAPTSHQLVELVDRMEVWFSTNYEFPDWLVQSGAP